MVEWDPDGREPPSAPLTHPDAVKQVAYTSDSRRLVTGDTAGTIRVWDVETRALLREFAAGANVFSLAISPDDELVAVGTVNGWGVWRLDGDGVRVYGATQPTSAVYGMRFIEPGRLLVVGETGRNHGITCHNTRLWRPVGIQTTEHGSMMGLSGPSATPVVHAVTATGHLTRRVLASPD
ncbi:MAG: hypothetical protein U0871_03215 [Gemmataceae bacterium]